MIKGLQSSESSGGVHECLKDKSRMLKEGGRKVEKREAVTIRGKKDNRLKR